MPALEAANSRRRRLSAAMEEAGIDLLVLHGNAWQNDYLRYAVDFGILEGEGLALVRRNGETTLLLDHPAEAERAAVECPAVDVIACDDPVAEVADVVQRAGSLRLAAAPYRTLPYRLSRQRDARAAADATGLLDRLLMRKSEEELDAIRRAAHLADEGYAIFRAAACEGRADYELVARIEAFFRENGVDDNFMLLGAGGREVRGMTPPVGKRLRRGDLVTTELTPCVDGYYVQICRTLAVGEPSAAQRKAFAVFHEAMLAGIAAVAPGVSAAAVAKAENDVFRRHGLGEYTTSEYTRVRGHGLGLFTDTKPHIVESNDTPIEQGMSLIVHPNTYHPDVGYIVLGDSLIVGANGAEVLTRTARELFGAPPAGSGR